jgi:hypothetical protein
VRGGVETGEVFNVKTLETMREAFFAASKSPA